MELQEHDGQFYLQYGDDETCVYPLIKDAHSKLITSHDIMCLEKQVTSQLVLLGRLKDLMRLREYEAKENL